MKTGVIWNPRAGGRRGQRGWHRAAAVLAAGFGELEVCVTGGPGHATELCAGLLARGFGTVLAAGGDGTAAEVADAFLSRPQAAGHACMGVVPLGTGSDLARSLGLPREPGAAAAALARSAPLAVDACRAVFRDPAGRPAQRWFVNMASFGLGGAVAAAGPPAGVGGRARYLLRALNTLRAYAPARVSLTLDGRRMDLESPLVHVAIGNARSQGAGIVICPDASLTDGRFDVTAILALRPREMLRHARLLYSGGIYRHPKVRHWQAANLRAEASTPVPLELDGSPAGWLPLEIQCVPGALRLLVPPRLTPRG